MPKIALLDPTRKGKQAEDFENGLRHFVVGQDEAIDQIVTAYQAYLSGLSPLGRPVGSFLFLGPTGSGKTRIVEATAEVLLKDPRSVIKIDCGEFQHSHEIAKLIGSPPGYIGHRETQAALSQEALNRYHTNDIKLSVVLFDEIEKGSDAVWNLLLGILDKASLTLGDNRKVDFSSTMIFLTSNLGAAEMSSLVSPRLGFCAPSIEDSGARAKVDAQMTSAATTAVQRRFTPEFINRLDKIAVFKPLGRKELRKIVDIELKLVQKRIRTAAANKLFRVKVIDSAKEFLLLEGTDSRYGARPLKRAIERLLVQPLSNLMTTGQIQPGDCIRVTHSDGSAELNFFRRVTEASEAESLASRAAA
jgi:ATP-dependent Clp protease ATP-binding subunit ClpB